MPDLIEETKRNNCTGDGVSNSKQLQSYLKILRTF